MTDLNPTVAAIRRKARQIAGPDDPMLVGAPTLQDLLVLAWMDEVRAYWRERYETASPEVRAEYDLAKSLCSDAGSDVDEIVMGRAGMQPAYAAVPNQGYLSEGAGRVVVLPITLGGAVPLWVHYVRLARTALAAMKSQHA